MAGRFIEMVTVVDKSGKAVKSNKHVTDIWNNAKDAYRERKAELASGKKSQRIAIEEDASSYYSPQSPSPRGPRPHNKSRRLSHEPRSPRALPSNDSMSCPTSPAQSRESSLAPALPQRPSHPARSRTAPSSPIDMHLAYGELPPSPTRTTPDKQRLLDSKIGLIQKLLQEADCLHHSATKTIAALQQKPEALAAVALTLAEISSLARKLTPAAMTSFKTGAPAVFALLASSEFLIAGGVAVGLTVVAFGGYTIIKKIRARNNDEQKMTLRGEAAPRRMYEAIDIGCDVNSINNWRRGIADEQASSVGSSVDGELITPHAAAMSRLNLDNNPRSIPRKPVRPPQLSSDQWSSGPNSFNTSHRKHRSRHHQSSGSGVSSTTASIVKSHNRERRHHQSSGSGLSSTTASTVKSHNRELILRSGDHSNNANARAYQGGH